MQGIVLAGEPTEMQRDQTLERFSRTDYDIVVVGGGIYGASVARDAAIRGLRVALLEKDDFGHATSANCHKIIHGGLRYIQHGDISRMRESIRERSALLRIAPHLVYPMPFLVPTYRGVRPGKLLMAGAVMANDLISIDRNVGLRSNRMIPNGRMVSRSECLRLCPGLDNNHLSGGVLFHDAQVHNADRLTLAVASSASSAGADIANYVQVSDVLQHRRAATGVKALDLVTGNHVELRAKIIVNCTGPWINELLDSLPTPGVKPTRQRLFKAVVLVTRQLVERVGLCIAGKSGFRDRDAVVAKGHRYFVVTPWRGKSLLGTFQVPFSGRADELVVTEEEIALFLEDFNEAYPTGNLSRDDVFFVYAGLLPASEEPANGEVQWLKQYAIVDHARDLGIQGVISVIGVKLTTARDVAEKVVDLVVEKLGRAPIPCRTAHAPVAGGEIECMDQTIEQLSKARPYGISSSSSKHLVQTYGAAYKEVLHHCEENESWAELVMPDMPTIKAEVIHGIRAEMAQRLADVILRRTDLGTAGYPGDQCLISCAGIMAGELNWTDSHTEQELESVRSHFRKVSSYPVEAASR